MLQTRINQNLLRKLSVAIEQTGDNVVITDRDGMIEYVNPSFEKNTGYSKNELIGQTPRVLNSGKHSKEFYERLWAKILAGDIFRATIINRKKSGELYWADQTITPVKDQEGTITNFVSVWKDITERIHHEEKIEELNQDLKKEKAKLEQVLNIEHGLNTFLSLEKLIDFIVDQTIELLEAGRCSFMLTNGKQEELCIKGHHGLHESVIRDTRIKMGEEVAGKVAHEGQGVLVFDIEKDHRFLKKNKSVYQSKSFLSVPIRLGDRLIGVINVSEKKSEQEPAFTELDLKILKMIARQVAVAIETARVSRELKHLQVTDSLTDLYNYRHFTTILDNEIKSLKRYPGTLSLTMIMVATRCPLIASEQRDPLLRQVGKEIQDHLREVDTICRYAGNEFVVVLPNTNTNEAQIAAFRTKEWVEKRFWKTGVQLSMGIAEYAPGLDRYELIVRANSALFRAKQDEKNRVCVFNHPKFQIPPR